MSRRSPEDTAENYEPFKSADIQTMYLPITNLLSVRRDETVDASTEECVIIT
jgi:hypothetical protein